MLRRVFIGVVVPSAFSLILGPVSVAFATTITFDLRDPIIETRDEVNSFPLMRDDVTATALTGDNGRGVVCARF